MPQRHARFVAAFIVASFAAWTVAAAEPLPVLEVKADDTIVDHSCTVRIAPGLVIADANGDGVIHVVKSGVTVAFEEGSVLRGSAPGTRPDSIAGVGLACDGVADVTLRGVSLAGFKVGVMASRADRLRIEGASCSEMWRMHLGSTPAAEDASDWLWPQANDGDEWVARYGAAVRVKRSAGVEIRDVTVRQSQNGIILDRVDDSKVYDNDCSFLSGWGIAMWRSSRNVVSRNACDFCVRGHSEGVYNRGQDSAGFLVFEQCRSNVFVENSATHCGDGFFGFAGKESLGETPPPAGVEPGSIGGCDDNVVADNDFSYASAHGIEMTFSRGNRFVRNRVVGNGICGYWGGYGTDTIIAFNHFERNGDLAYGLERGAINIEHGSRTRIDRNTFLDNRCGVHLWWDDDRDLLAKPRVKAMGGGLVTGTVIAANAFQLTADNGITPGRDGKRPLIGVQLRDVPGGEHVKGTVLTGDNVIELNDPRAIMLDKTDGIDVAMDLSEKDLPPLPDLRVEAIGRRTVVGARSRLAGRANIIMGEWGPWDHVEPLVVPLVTTGGRHVYAVYGAVLDEVSVTCNAKWAATNGVGTLQRTLVEVWTDDEQAAVAYDLSITAGSVKHETRGMLVNASWECAAFSWSADPRTELERWRKERQLIPQAAVSVRSIDFRFGRRGPKGLPAFREVADIAPGPDKFGLVAVSTMRLPKGRWRFTTLSDDGVRVTATGYKGDRIETRPVIENWTWHGPTTDTAVFTNDFDSDVTIAIEYFQLDGEAVLRFDLAPEPGN